MKKITNINNIGGADWQFVKGCLAEYGYVFVNNCELQDGELVVDYVNSFDEMAFAVFSYSDNGDLLMTEYCLY